MRRLALGMAWVVIASGALFADPPQIDQAPLTWVKRSPLKDGPVSPSLGYETSLGYDPIAKRVIRWGGHNQGGGGEQNGETWSFDPITAKWELKEPNTSPPGVCCAQQNVFDPVQNRFIRFPAFSGSHGWHWFRENYLSNSSVWSYDLATNTWRDRRPAPGPHPKALHCASWDDQYGVIVFFGGEGSDEGTFVYDPHANRWKKMRPKVEPASRSAGNMAYLEAHGVHLLFGSQFSDDPHTWIYDLAKNEWRDMKPVQQPPTSHNDAVLAYDANSGCGIAVVKVPDRIEGMESSGGHLETWAYDYAKNEWKQLAVNRQPDTIGNRRRVMTTIPDQNLLLLEAYVNPTEKVQGVDREQQIWTFRYQPQKGASPAAKPMPRTGPRIVEDIVVSVADPKRISLAWKSPGDDVVGYHIERADVEVFSEDQILRLKKDTAPLDEPSIGSIKYVGEFKRLTDKPIAALQFDDTTIDLTSPKKVAGEPIFRHRFRDDQLDAQGKPYRYHVVAYRVRGVNSLGVEGGDSPYVLSIPSAPMHVFEKEEGEQAHLKWAANPERAIRGYRVYRMEGPKLNGPGQPVTRLTAEPISATTYTDSAATKETKRYWIVAVDALGQEGIPSAPAWHYRQFRKFYEPFTGEWHQ